MQVAVGDVDVAVGGDQGGSIRLPSCWCGIVGMKPTYGLVPYTGILEIDSVLDCCGPMARTVHDCALLLEVTPSSRGTFSATFPVAALTCQLSNESYPYQTIHS